MTITQTLNRGERVTATVVSITEGGARLTADGVSLLLPNSELGRTPLASLIEGTELKATVCDVNDGQLLVSLRLRWKMLAILRVVGVVYILGFPFWLAIPSVLAGIAIVENWPGPAIASVSTALIMILVAASLFEGSLCAGSRTASPEAK